VWRKNRKESHESADNDRKGTGRAGRGLRRGRHLRTGGYFLEFPGIILGGLGYYFGLTSQDRVGQILGVAAVVLNVISMVISGLLAPPQ
jgi:hypothetical protein